MKKIEQVLRYPNRTLRAYPGKLLFGPVQRRLFVDCLDKLPGFCGHIDFIHKINIDQLFTITPDVPVDWVMATTEWTPLRLSMYLENEHVVFSETKTLVEKDIALSVQTWTNRMAKPLTLTFQVAPTGCETTKEGGRTFFHTPEPYPHGIHVGVCAGWEYEEDHIQVAPGACVTFYCAAAVGNMETDGKEEICARLNAYMSEKKNGEERLKDAIDQGDEFYGTVPVFVSSDALLNKTWWYRWYILHNATSYPAYGKLQHPTVYEGRAHKTSKKEPLKNGGWEFSRLIILSSPLQMTDYRWYEDKELLHEFVRGYFDTMDDNGILQSVFTDHAGSPFSNFLIWAVYRMYLVDGDVEFIKEMLPKMQKCVDGNTEVYGAKNDYLQIEVKHQRTGKEFQPSYWYFTDFPLNGKDKSKIIPMKRMDTSVYHYLNIKGLSRMMEAAGDPQAEKYAEMAETLAKQINDKTWDEETGFYYDLHYETDEKAMVKNIVGIYPYWAEIADPSRLNGLEKLFDPAYFNTGSVFSTVAKDCRAYAPHGGWMGAMKSRDGCVWDGPSWPYTNGIALEAIGRQSKLNGHKYDKEFAEFLRKYSLQHYRHQDVTQPYLVEQYHAETGEDLSDEPDYNHSYYLDLIVGYVCGLDVQEDKMVIDPLDLGLEYFTLDHIKVRGREVKIVYEKEAGLQVFVDGVKAAEADGLEKLEISF